jgi:hypothetical protein
MGIMKKTLSLTIVWLLLTAMSSQTGIPRAQAMFIYNFSRLIEWPANFKSGPFVIGVYGNSQTLNELQNYTANKTVGAQKIMIKKFTTPAEIGTCHILFIPFGKTKQLPQIAQAIGSKSTLIITEKNGATDLGAAINFVIIGDKLKFEIKPSNASSRKINMSSKLNEMAYKRY